MLPPLQAGLPQPLIHLTLQTFYLRIMSSLFGKNAPICDSWLIVRFIGDNGDVAQNINQTRREGSSFPDLNLHHVHATCTAFRRQQKLRTRHVTPGD